jgi:hypothetical protein
MEVEWLDQPISALMLQGDTVDKSASRLSTRS